MNKEIIFKKYLILFTFVPLIFSIGIAPFLFLPDVYAAQKPPIIALIYEDPFYFSQNDFGISLLRYFDEPLTPYLTPGVTDKSTTKEIMDAYDKATANLSGGLIEKDSDRAISYVAHFQSPEIYKDVTSFSFRLFNPATNPYEFTLESLTSKENQDFYEFASRYINPGKRPDPFDVTIDVVTGDGTILQKWKYLDCKLTYFETYLQETLLYLMYAGGIASEIRDQFQFECRTSYFDADMDNVFNPYANYHGKQHDIKSYPTDLLNKVPTTNDRAMSYVVSFVGRDIPEEVSFQTFQKFGPTGSTITAYDPQTGLSISPQFFLESLISKDKKEYYEYISRYINPGKIPEPFDVNVDLVAGDGTPILRWQYFHCKVTNFEVKFKDSVLIKGFHPGSDAEIRDHSEFECEGFHLTSQFDKAFSPYVNLQRIGQTIPITKEGKLVIPTSNDRAMSFVVHFSDGDFGDTTKTIRTFPKFDQTALTEFDLESLPSQDKNEIYDLIVSHSLNPGRKPAPFSVTVDLVAGDETILQKWQYYQCQVSDYQTQLNERFSKASFVGKHVLEIRDTISFDCIGVNLVADPLKPFSPFVNLQRPGQTVQITKESPGIIPTDETRAMSYVVHLSGTDIPQEETFTTFTNFETHGKTVSSEGSSLVSDEQKPAFYLEALPSKDKEKLYMLLAKYINPGKKPFPFDVTVDMVSGDNTILQKWEYFDCQLVSYDPSLEDSLLVIKYSPPSAVEIRGKALYECEAFHFETPRMEVFSPYANLQKLSENIEISNETGSIVPSNNARPMSYVVEFSSGDIIIPHKSLTFSKYKQTGTTQFWLESLPSQDKELFYDFIIARYINHGPKPQLLDISVDLVTGDGTVLQSWQYHKCKATDYVTYKDSNLMFSRFTGKLDYELRDKTTFDCAGVDIDIENKIPLSIYTDLFTKGLKVKPIVTIITDPPHAQLKSGTSANEIECKREMELMIRPSNTLPYCVKSHRVNVLQGQDWEHISKKPTDESKTEPTILQAVLPTDDERGMSYKISAIGIEVPKEFQSLTISNFAPFTTSDITIDGVTIPGDTSTLFGVMPYYHFGDKPSFYVESLPAKDRIEVYKWLSRYTNPGKTPDPIDVGIQIFDGSKNLLQTWMYRDCTVVSFQVFLDQYILGFKFHGKWFSEIKDRTMFSCGGLHLNEV